jgi:hypothetical protein
MIFFDTNFATHDTSNFVKPESSNKVQSSIHQGLRRIKIELQWGIFRLIVFARNSTLA